MEASCHPLFLRDAIGLPRSEVEVLQSKKAKVRCRTMSLIAFFHVPTLRCW